MSEYKKLLDEFNQKVEELQRTCPHTEQSEPQEVYWALGHSAGYKSRYCLRCGKQMNKPKWNVNENE
jgi:hypothetical protein